MTGQLRLDTTHLMRGDADDCFAMKLSNFGRSATHSSSMSMIRYVVLKLVSRSTSAKISDKAAQAFVSSNKLLPAWLYFLRTCDTSDDCWCNRIYSKPRSTAAALLMRESVVWQKKYDKRVDLGVEFRNSSVVPHSSIVLHLPGSPFTHKSRLSWSSCHCWKVLLSRTQR